MRGVSKLDLLITKIDKMDVKVDKLDASIREVRETIVPNLKIDAAELKTEIKTEAKLEAKNHARFWGMVALAISAISVAVAYFK